MYLYVIVVGISSGAAVVVVLSLVIATIVAITCCFVKRKARKLNSKTTDLLLHELLNHYRF